MAHKKIYEINKYSKKALVINESVDPADEFSREINTMFKTDDVRRVMQAFYDQCDENAKAILLDVVREEFLNKYAAPEGSGPDGSEASDGGIFDDGGSDGDFDFELDGADIDGDDTAEDGGSDGNPDGGEPAGDPFAVRQEAGNPEDRQTGGNPFFESARNRTRLRSLNEKFMRVRKPRNRKEAEMLSRRILESFHK